MWHVKHHIDVSGTWDLDVTCQQAYGPLSEVSKFIDLDGTLAPHVKLTSSSVFPHFFRCEILDMLKV